MATAAQRARRGSEAQAARQRMLYNQAQRALGRDQRSDWAQLREPDTQGFMNMVSPGMGGGSQGSSINRLLDFLSNNMQVNPVQPVPFSGRNQAGSQGSQGGGGGSVLDTVQGLLGPGGMPGMGGQGMPAFGGFGGFGMGGITPPPGYGINGLAEAYQAAMDQHRQANEDRYAEGHGELSDLRSRSMDRIGTLGQQARQDIVNNSDRRAAERHSDLVSRGLTASDIGIANDTVTNRERNYELNRLQDQLTRQQLDADRAMTGDLVGFVERRNDLPPDSNQLIALAQNAGQYGGAMTPLANALFGQYGMNQGQGMQQAQPQGMIGMQGVQGMQSYSPLSGALYQSYTQQSRPATQFTLRGRRGIMPQMGGQMGGQVMPAMAGGGHGGGMIGGMAPPPQMYGTPAWLQPNYQQTARSTGQFALR